MVPGQNKVKMMVETSHGCQCQPVKGVVIVWGGVVKSLNGCTGRTRCWRLNEQFKEWVKVSTRLTWSTTREHGLYEQKEHSSLKQEGPSFPYLLQVNRFRRLDDDSTGSRLLREAGKSSSIRGGPGRRGEIADQYNQTGPGTGALCTLNNAHLIVATGTGIRTIFLTYYASPISLE